MRGEEEGVWVRGNGEPRGGGGVEIWDEGQNMKAGGVG